MSSQKGYRFSGSGVWDKYRGSNMVPEKCKLLLWTRWSVLHSLTFPCLLCLSYEVSRGKESLYICWRKIESRSGDDRKNSRSFQILCPFPPVHWDTLTYHTHHPLLMGKNKQKSLQSPTPNPCKQLIILKLCFLSVKMPPVSYALSAVNFSNRCSEQINF